MRTLPALKRVANAIAIAQTIENRLTISFSPPSTGIMCAHSAGCGKNLPKGGMRALSQASKED